MKKLWIISVCSIMVMAVLAGCATKTTDASVKKDPAMAVQYIMPEMKLQMSVPSDWTIYGNGEYLKNGRTQLHIEDYYFNAKQAGILMKEFGYADEKECMRHYFFNGSEADEGVKYDKQELIFPSYRFKLTADKYYRDGKGHAQDNQEPVIVQAMIDEENNKLHMFYFTDEMADEKKVDKFLAGLSRYDEKKIYDEDFGLYRWQNGADYFDKQ